MDLSLDNFCFDSTVINMPGTDMGSSNDLTLGESVGSVVKIIQYPHVYLSAPKHSCKEATATSVLQVATLRLLCFFLNVHAISFYTYDTGINRKLEVSWLLRPHMQLPLPFLAAVEPNIIGCLP
jgi:hypothetical protein